MAESQAIYHMRITPGMGYITGPEGRLAEQQALKHDRERSYRVVINIVGKERQGKTSLRRLLSSEQFNPNEQSTVGIDKELVETMGIDPGTSWSKVDLHDANNEEFDIILGKHILQRLKKTSPKSRTLKHVVAPVLCLGKIALITYLMLFVYFVIASSGVLRGCPWFGCMLIFIFAISGLTFGTRDGFGIAIGIYQLLILCEAMSRWRLDDWFVDLKSKSCFTMALCIGFMSYALLEALVGLSFGLSLGVGIACIYCITQPPSAEYLLKGNPLESPLMHIFILGCLVGVGSMNYRDTLLYIIVPLLGIAVKHIPQTYGFALFCGIGCGHTHAIFLTIGQNCFCILNAYIKRIAENPRPRRIIRHCFGFIPGSLLAKVFGWSLADDLIIHGFTAVLLIVSIEVLNHVYGQISKDPSPSSCNVKHPSKVIGARVKNASLKLVVKDFAGHPLYYTAHHMYMTGQCVYLLVFNLVEAKDNFNATFGQVLGWLQSIYVHNFYPDVRVFIVGTHRDDPSLSETMTGIIGERLKQSLPRQFHNVVVWNDNDLPLFVVENSVRDEQDEDHENLREKLLKEVNCTNDEKYPVKYFFFFGVIEKYRMEGKLIEKYDKVNEVCQQNDCSVKTSEEFEELLQFFSKSGEILYNTKDNILRDFIIFDPQTVINIISRIVTVPKMSERSSNLISEWEMLAKNGICSEKLFMAALGEKSATDIDCIETVMYLLENFNLLCRIQTNDGLNKERYYLIPALLPQELPFPSNYWEDGPRDFEYIVDCGPILPLPAFLRLICKCAAFDTSVRGEDGNFRLNASQTKALFTYENSYSYKLEVLENGSAWTGAELLASQINSCLDRMGSNFSESESGVKFDSCASETKVNSLSQSRKLRILVRSDRNSEPRDLLTFIWHSLKRIIHRDFTKCRLRLGVRCPCDAPHQDCLDQESIHLLSVADNTCSCLECSIPSAKDFWCRGRKVVVQDGRAAITIGNERRSATPPVNSFMSTPIMDLPQKIYSKVCDYLNIPNALKRDWTMLAGELGKTSHEVSLLRFRCPRDPCDALLQDWASRHPHATLRDLVNILRDMERLDVIAAIGEV